VLAYWMFYHAGVSSLIAHSKPNEFWHMVWRAQKEKWPRGTERRHFKAENSRKSIEYLQAHFNTAEDAVTWVSSAGILGLSKTMYGKDVSVARFHEIIRKAQTWVGFGPWIAFKIADMVDAVLHVPVSFEEAAGDLFEDPMAGAFCVLHQAGKVMLTQPPYDAPDLVSVAKEATKSMSRTERVEVVQEAVNLLKYGGLGELRSPSNPDRVLGLQEYETIFCKYKSHLNGHYPMGKDTFEILHVLEDPRWGPLGQHLGETLQKAGGPI
jgi:hypothetical protein